MIDAVSWIALAIVVIYILARPPHPDELDELERIRRRRRALREADRVMKGEP